MGLFNRNKSSSPKHYIIDVIKYDGPNDIMIWQHPNRDFNNNSKLIVGPSQEALFVSGGQVLERFLPGTYTLNSKNYPFIRSLIGLVTGGDSPFSCVVYYINKAYSLGIDWGTDAPISVVDPVYRVPVDVRSYGDFGLRVEDGRKLMEKLVGQTQGFTQEEVNKYFSAMMATQIRSVISGTMMEYRLSAIGIDAHLPQMSEAAAEKLRPVFEPYGLALTHFTIAGISAPELAEIKKQAREIIQDQMYTENDVYKQQRKAQVNAYEENIKTQTDVYRTTQMGQADAFAKKQMAEAKAMENNLLGITEQEKMVGEGFINLTKNTGPNMAAGGGMPFPGIMGGNILQPSAAGAADIAEQLLRRERPQNPMQDFSGTMPGGGMPGMGMMEEAAPQTPPQPKESFEERAMKVKFLLDKGLITQEQYDEKIRQLMDEI